jgi:hypothetical protein
MPPAKEKGMMKKSLTKRYPAAEVPDRAYVLTTNGIRGDMVYRCNDWHEHRLRDEAIAFRLAVSEKVAIGELTDYLLKERRRKRTLCVYLNRNDYSVWAEKNHNSLKAHYRCEWYMPAKLSNNGLLALIFRSDTSPVAVVVVSRLVSGRGLAYVYGVEKACTRKLLVKWHL